jgi:hypothetical protein
MTTAIGAYDATANRSTHDAATNCSPPSDADGL